MQHGRRKTTYVPHFHQEIHLPDFPPTDFQLGDPDFNTIFHTTLGLSFSVIALSPTNVGNMSLCPRRSISKRVHPPHCAMPLVAIIRGVVTDQC